jgi:hypothetical protein
MALMVQAAVAAPQAPQAGTGGGGISVEPGEITAGLFYHGGTVHVSAVVPAGAGVAFLCEGHAGPLTVNRKGKAVGLLWMNVGEVSWNDVPEVYLLRTSEALDQLASSEVLEGMGVGLDAVRTGSRPGAGADAFFAELAKLKARGGLWDVTEGGVDFRVAQDGWALAGAELALSPRASPGAYRILVYAFVDGRGELVGTGEVRVTQGGLPAFISSLAAEHGLLYGILSVGIAVGVGLLTGVVFGLGSKGGH